MFASASGAANAAGHKCGGPLLAAAKQWNLAVTDHKTLDRGVIARACCGPLDAVTETLLLEAAASGGWGAIVCTMASEACRASPWLRTQTPIVAEQAVHILVTLFLAAQAATAPAVATAAAAACALACALQPPHMLAGRSSQPLAADTDRFIAAAVQRPQFLAAMARCSGGRSLRGVLAIAALLPSVSPRCDAQLPGRIASALRPASAAALEAETQNAASSWAELCRLLTAARLAEHTAMAIRAGQQQHLRDELLVSAAKFLLQLDAAMGQMTEAALELHGVGGVADDGAQPISGSGSTVDDGAPSQHSMPIGCLLILSCAMQSTSSAVVHIIGAAAGTRQPGGEAGDHAGEDVSRTAVRLAADAVLEAVANMIGRIATVAAGRLQPVVLETLLLSLPGVIETQTAFLHAAAQVSCERLSAAALAAVQQLAGMPTTELKPVAGTPDPAVGLVYAAIWLWASFATTPATQRKPRQLSATDVAGVAAALGHGMQWLSDSRGNSPAQQEQLAEGVKCGGDLAEALVPVLLQQADADGQDEVVVETALEALARFMELDPRMLVVAAPIATYQLYEFTQALAARAAAAGGGPHIQLVTRLAVAALTVGIAVVLASPPAKRHMQWRNRPLATTAMHGLATLLSAVPAAAAAAAAAAAVATHEPLVARLACAVRVAAQSGELSMLPSAAPLTAVCAAIVTLLAATPDESTKLLQQGHAAEWAAVVTKVEAAVPPRLRRQALAALTTVTEALQRATPEGRAAAQQEAAAAAAADAAMRELLLQEAPAAAPPPGQSKAARKRAAKKAAARAAQQEAAQSGAAPLQSASAGAHKAVSSASQPLPPRQTAAGAMAAAQSESQQPPAADSAATTPATPLQRALGGGTSGPPAAQSESAPPAAGSPDWQICPLTEAVLVDPVVLLGDGRTYERAAIVAWLQDHSTSPVTGEPLGSRDVVANHALRGVISSMAALDR